MARPYAKPPYRFQDQQMFKMILVGGHLTIWMVNPVYP